MKCKDQKIFFALSIFVFLSANINAQKYRFGIQGSPALNFIRSNQENAESKVALKFGFGLISEFRFAKNYYIASGVNILRRGGGLEVRDTVGNYQGAYVQIPLVLKLKTREFGYTTFYGKFGSGLSFKTSEKVSFEKTPSRTLNSYLETFNFPFIVGLGAEYSLGGPTSLMAEITFNGALLNDFDSANTFIDDAGIYRINNVALTIGVLF